MGFMDKAKQMAQQVQQEAKDGTLKERAKQMADQAQQKLDEVQGQMAGAASSTAGGAPAVEYDQHGRPIATEATPDAAVPPPAPPAEGGATEPGPGTPAPAPPAAPAAPKAPPAAGSGLTGGDPLAG